MSEKNNIRNFCIIAHIDHGKSTLADRMLELTGTVEARKMKEQLLDQMDLERERGITIKMQPVRMIYQPSISNSKFPNQAKISNEKKDDSNGNGKSFKNSDIENSLKIENLKFKVADLKDEYILNLIDTPGHVDFGYEVSRSLAAVEGAVLLVDATKGVQAQTLANLYQAIEHNLEIIPVVNKIDLPNADIKKTKREIVYILGCQEEEILEISGKTGEGVSALLETIVNKIPPPQGKPEKPLRALIFDSKYDTYKGVLAYVRIFDGEVSAEEEIFMMANGAKSDTLEVGYFKPNLEKTEKLSAGEIGYIATGFKSVEFCRVGDTITLVKNLKNGKKDELITPLPGYKEPRPMVYASFYPTSGEDYNLMRDSFSKLKLNDAAFVFELESNLALGRGFRCGFLGLLHLEIIQSRLEREFEISPTITTPSVIYEIKLKNKEERISVYSPAEFPDPSVIEEVYEPYVKLEVVSPTTFLGAIMEVMKNTRAEYKNTQYLEGERIIMKFSCPLTDVITDLHDDIKSATQGYASFSYELEKYQPYDLIKMDIMVGGEKVDAFSRIVPKEKAFSEGKRVVEKLKEAIPRQNFQIAIQATIGTKVIARETIQAFRKDVTAKLYGGDVTRKRKLLEKQKKGKKKMKNIGRVAIPSEAFLKVLKK
ncbi:MAG: elongation factor 4 [Candidatus Moranbacteria bacterium CG_4_8_14_3_um_filter_34_16]|nr:MAG: elongation factor 4 [Candidatus Moranbacteria bacterium CG08_land_8_20_14_0_20_34_16]PIW95151.1 MAG: elongation factor 4 [Candidatus Moranbacteria bacterium CG_4_8_14_3_um_filter_34_16]